MSRMIITFGGLASVLLACGNITSAQHVIDGRTSEEIFQDPDVALLAGAVCRGAGQEAEAILDRIPDVDTEGHLQVTPLLWAITCGNVDGVEVLLKHGADPNKRTQGGLSPMTLAASVKNVEILRLLVGHGGNVNASEGSFLSTVLYKSMYSGIDSGYWDNFDYILNEGADTHTRGDMDILLELAVFGQFQKLLELTEEGRRPSDLQIVSRMIFSPTLGGHAQVRAKIEVYEMLLRDGHDVIGDLRGWRTYDQLRLEIDEMNRVRLRV